MVRSLGFTTMTQVQFLVEELRSCKLHGVIKKEREKRKKENMQSDTGLAQEMGWTCIRFQKTLKKVPF